MNKTKLLFAFTSLCALCVADGQGTFQNLNFESAIVPSLPSDQPAFVPFTNAFPGWYGMYGTVPPTRAADAAYNGISGGAVELSLFTRTTATYSNFVIGGNYTAAIQAGIY